MKRESFKCVITQRFCVFSLTAIFYYYLWNIFPVYCSTMKAILLLAITKSSVLTKYCPDVILRNFMEDIKKLESVSYLF